MATGIEIKFSIGVRSSRSHSQSSRARSPRARVLRVGVGHSASRSRVAADHGQLTTRHGVSLIWAASGTSWLRPACWPTRPPLQNIIFHYCLRSTLCRYRLSSLYDSYGRAGLARSSVECYRAPATKHITLLATEGGRLAEGCRVDAIEIRLQQTLQAHNRLHKVKTGK